MEERRGSWLERLSRLAARGREDTTPVVLHNAILLVLALFVGAVIAVALGLWFALR